MSDGALAGDGIATLSGVVFSTLVLTAMTTSQSMITIRRTLEVERWNTARHHLNVTTLR